VVPAISFVIPAFNEQSLIVETIQTYLSLPQEKKEIIIINDGSHDKTFQLLQTMFQLRRTSAESNLFRSISYPCLLVIESKHAGKAQALNLGIKHATFDLVCTMDADTIPTSHGVEASLKAFAQDSKLVATGGIIQVLDSQFIKGNSPLKKQTLGWLTRFQSLEYMRTFICVRLGWSLIGSTALISGAFCMLKKEY
jgi:cellulose synthase/poly-beta-1,6-N-acetylglucosamine synthase-like glycosyltransferase